MAFAFEVIRVKWIVGLWFLVFSVPAFSQLTPGELPVRERKRSPIESGIFRGDWWDLYNRAIRRMNQGDLAGAETDLREAIKYQPEGGLRVRTYGVRFQEYLPHLELGMILFTNGRYDEAIQSLRRSLQTVQLEETQFFLHEAHRQRALKMGSDQSPPEIFITQPPPGMVTNQTSVTIRGTALDDIFVDSLMIDNQPVLIPKAQDQFDFSRELSLDREINRIPIVVTDLVGRSTVHEIVVEVDRQGPILNLHKMDTASGSGKVRLVGTFYDKYGVAGVTVNGEPLTISPSPSVSIDQTIAVGENEGPIQIVSLDEFGNSTVSDVDPKTKVGEGPPVESQVRVAGLGLNPGWFQSAPAKGPKIDMRGLHNQQKVYIEELYVDGQVTDSTDIQNIEFNGAPLDIQPGTHLFFSYLVGPLEVGSNTLEVKATNRSREVSTKRVRIECELPTQLRPERWLSVVIPEFETEDESIDNDALFFLREMIKNEILNRQRFDLVDDDATYAVLRENELRASGLVDTRYSLRPDLISADLVLDGMVKQIGETISLYVSVVSTSSKLVLARLETHAPDKTQVSLQEMARGLVLKLEVKFPRMEGQVVRTEPRVLAEMSIPEREKRGLPAVAFHNEGEILLSNGRSGGIYWREVGLLNITRPGTPVTEFEWNAETLPDESALTAGDLVVTK